MLANRLPKSVPGTRCGAGLDASKQGAQIGARHPVRRQAPGVALGGMLANRWPKSVPGTGGPNRCQAPGAAPGRMLANRGPKSVPGTRYGARSPTSGFPVGG